MATNCRGHKPTIFAVAYMIQIFAEIKCARVLGFLDQH